MKNKKVISIAITVFILTMVMILFYFWVVSHPSRQVFGLKDKLPGTQLYYSDRLGLGFTYYLFDSQKQFFEADKIKISEVGSHIQIFYDNKKLYEIIVFSKDPKISLADAIKETFLKNYSSKDCFPAKDNDDAENQPAGYDFYRISYPSPPANDEYAPFWTNMNKCPADYSYGPWISFFEMNLAVPDKFIFVYSGQSSFLGTGLSEDLSEDDYWYHSIHILK